MSSSFSSTPSPSLAKLSQRLNSVTSLVLERSRVVSLSLPPNPSTDASIVRSLMTIKQGLTRLVEERRRTVAEDGSELSGLKKRYEHVIELMEQDEIGRNKVKDLKLSPEIHSDRAVQSGTKASDGTSADADADADAGVNESNNPFRDPLEPSNSSSPSGGPDSAHPQVNVIPPTPFNETVPSLGLASSSSGFPSRGAGAGGAGAFSKTGKGQQIRDGRPSSSSPSEGYRSSGSASTSRRPSSGDSNRRSSDLTRPYTDNPFASADDEALPYSDRPARTGTRTRNDSMGMGMGGFDDEEGPIMPVRVGKVSTDEWDGGIDRELDLEAGRGLGIGGGGGGGDEGNRGGMSEQVLLDGQRLMMDGEFTRMGCTNGQSPFQFLVTRSPTVLRRLSSPRYFHADLFFFFYLLSMCPPLPSMHRSRRSPSHPFRLDRPPIPHLKSHLFRTRSTSRSPRGNGRSTRSNECKDGKSSKKFG